MVAAVNSKVKLPDQGKFNAAEKINFMVLMGTYPLYIATGALHLADARRLSVLDLLHVLMALHGHAADPGAHVHGLIDRGGRPGLTGMITGYVDRQWAKHHYRHWYREHHEADEAVASLAAPVQEENTPAEMERN